MDWQTLLSKQRLGKPTDSAPRPDADEFRSPFLIDYDRIVFTTAFRRLQDKTQVFPLSSSDFVRTRLTHSIEVSCVARNLGTMIGRRLLRMDKLSEKIIRGSDIGNIAAAASLAHDIGNPPFGHSGEAAMRNWFLTSKTAQQLANDLNEGQVHEFQQYEGNAHAFRLVSRLLSPSRKGGLQLTYATLASIAKYPIAAHSKSDLYLGRVSAKKYNFFSAEAPFFEEVARGVKLKRQSSSSAWWCRHPIAFICEVADDITNSIIDYEDGYRLGCISPKQTIDTLKKVLTDRKRLNAAKRISSEHERIKYLRSVVISQLTEEASDVFIDRLDGLLDGTFDESLFEYLPSRRKIDPIHHATKELVYTDRRVLGVETAGFEIIYQLLERFTEAAQDERHSKQTRNEARVRSNKTLGLLPPQFRASDAATVTSYDLLLSMTDFVAGMTDSYAVETFQRITGQKFVT